MYIWLHYNDNSEHTLRSEFDKIFAYQEQKSKKIQTCFYVINISLTNTVLLIFYIHSLGSNINGTNFLF